MFLAWNTPPQTVTTLLNPNVSTSWQRYAFLIKWDAGAAVEPLGQFYPSVGYGDGGGNIWFDDAMITEGDTLGAYAASALDAYQSANSAQVTANTAQSQATANTASLQNKLTKNGSDILSGQISLQSQFALLVGSFNDGLYMGSSGLVGRKAGTTTFVIGADGSATFGGQLQAAFGTLGSLHIANGGGIHGGAMTGEGWPATGAGVGCFLGQGGGSTDGGGLLRMGNYNDGKYFQISYSGDVYAPGLQIISGAATFSGTLSAASGTFAGSLSAAGGTFSGTLSGVNGTFSGTLTADNVVARNNIVNNAVTSSDIFSSVSSPVAFVVAANSNVVINARVGTTPGDAVGFRVYYEGVVGSPGSVADTAVYTESSASAGSNTVGLASQLALGPGTYFIGPYNTSSIVNVNILKVYK